MANNRQGNLANSKIKQTDLSSVLLQIAVELGSAKDFYQLSSKTLEELRGIAPSEGASLYLAKPNEKKLDLVLMQNESVDVRDLSISVALDKTSTAGACAVKKTSLHIPNVNHLRATSPFRFNKSFDDQSGYETRDILCFPLVRRDRELVGVVQLVNSKREGGFNSLDIEIGSALSNLISVNIERAMLYDQVEDLFEGFVKASVTAIESRDPCTSGHSERVAAMTVGMARAVNDINDGPFAKRHFSKKAIREIRFAGLLHDFGKIGVPENVLLKEKKLYPHQLREISLRLQLLSAGHPEKREAFSRIWKLVRLLNEPTVLPESNPHQILEKFVGKTMRVYGQLVPIITPEEWELLSIEKGSLNLTERARIQSHVDHTLKYLAHVPWTKDLHRVPEIAAAHHEKLDGSGYPFGLSEKKIPFESQMMSICDIYDALVAKDRPYKKRVPFAKARQILRAEADNGKLHQDLVDIFFDQMIYREGKY